MNTNPYQAPRDSGAAGDHPVPRLVWSWSSFLLTLLMSYVIAAIVTPADPLSSLLATVPIFLGMMFARWSGVRAGRRQAATDRAT